MVINLNGVYGGRGAAPVRPSREMRRQLEGAIEASHQSLLKRAESLVRWMHRGYAQANAGDLAAAVAFSALVALIPTLLLTLSVAGLFFRIDSIFKETIYTSFWGLPSSQAGDAIQTVLTARRSSSWLGVVSLAGFAWTGSGFVGCLSRSMNRIYGVPGCGYMCEKRRGFFVILAFAFLFMLALLASTIPTLFVNQDLPIYFQTWALSAGRNQILGYAIAFFATGAMFLMLYRVVPNAGQHVADVWPGTLIGAILFVILAQVFPIYIRLLGGVNRYGAAFGLMTLLVAWFWILAHLLLFGAYVNSTHQRHRRASERRLKRRIQDLQRLRHQS
jgi:membrane protein